MKKYYYQNCSQTQDAGVSIQMTLTNNRQVRAPNNTLPPVPPRADCILHKHMPNRQLACCVSLYLHSLTRSREG